MSDATTSRLSKRPASAVLEGRYANRRALPVDHGAPYHQGIRVSI